MSRLTVQGFDGDCIARLRYYFAHILPSKQVNHEGYKRVKIACIELTNGISNRASKPSNTHISWTDRIDGSKVEAELLHIEIGRDSDLTILNYLEITHALITGGNPEYLEQVIEACCHRVGRFPPPVRGGCCSPMIAVSMHTLKASGALKFILYALNKRAVSHNLNMDIAYASAFTYKSTNTQLVNSSGYGKWGRQHIGSLTDYLPVNYYFYINRAQAVVDRILDRFWK